MTQTDPVFAMLSAREQRFVEGILAGLSVQAAAEQAGISRKTGFRWLQRETVRQAIQEGKRERWTSLEHKLQRYADQALSVVVEVMNGNAGAATRLRAAIAVLDLVVKISEYTELEQRVTELENRLREVKP